MAQIHTTGTTGCKCFLPFGVAPRGKRWRLHLSRPLRTVLLGHARAAWPRECCGLVLGRQIDPRSRRAVEIFPTPNAAASRAEHAFLITPGSLLGAHRRAVSLGVVLLGLFHSHPHGLGELSLADEAAAVPGWSHLILTPDPHAALSLRSFVFVANEGRFIEEELLPQSADRFDQPSQGP